MFQKSTAQMTYEYETEPAIVAQACQDALNRVGKVTEVSRETGTINGKIDTGFYAYAPVLLRVCKKGDITELSVQASRNEGYGLWGTNGAQKAIGILMQAMGQDTR